MNFTNNLEEAKKLDELKNKMLKYILFKKRSEAEVRQKFLEEDENLVEDAIEYFKELKYIDDGSYVERAVKEFMAIKKMSIKEMEYKMCKKGIEKSLIDDYICKNKEDMLEYEISSAKAIIFKKSTSKEKQEIRKNLYQKGYMEETINIAFDEIDKK